MLTTYLSIVEQLRKSQAYFVPSIVVGELYYGAYNSNKINENLIKINEFIEVVSILSCDDETAKYYGQLKKLLKDIGRPIPENDIWIGALALQYNLILVSRDKHFSSINNIDHVIW